MRCVLESQLHTENSFVTLTYDDKNLPSDGSLRKPDLQKFFKRLRKNRGPFRYYACGEYGETTNRAHYHACIFGLDFADKTPFRKIGEHVLYISEKLNEIWGHGNTSIGNLTFETAAYTARYVTKKLSKGQSRYVRLDEETGEIVPLLQPFAAMSLRPAIGLDWLHQFHGDIYGHDKDFLVMRGRKMKPPKYFDKIYDTIDNDRLEALRAKRQTTAPDQTKQTLHARAKIAHARSFAKSQI